MFFLKAIETEVLLSAIVNFTYLFNNTRFKVVT